jgi:lipoyl(octanoyl) transferase
MRIALATRKPKTRDEERRLMARFDFKDLGVMSYEEAYGIQMELVGKRMRGEGRDTVLLLEHPAVYTFGRRGRTEHIRGSYDGNVGTIEGARLVQSDRGGDITFHGPGQLVIYPIVALRVGEQKLRPLLQCYEEVIIQPLRAMGVEAFRVEGKTGVWTAQGKIASIGVGIKRWVTYHGIALNVATDLTYFDRIVPCGLHDCKMVNLNSLLPRAMSVADMKSAIIATFEGVWGRFAF